MPARRLISDPGYRLVRAAAEAGVEVVTVPGPSAVDRAAVGAAGLPTDRFRFEGFPPSRERARAACWKLRGAERTVVFYESPHRVAAFSRTWRRRSALRRSQSGAS